MATCKKGMILRKSYNRKPYTRKAYTTKSGIRIKPVKVSGSHVKRACIKDLGNPGKGKKLFTLGKGDLTSFGYTLKSNAVTRRSALKKSSKKFNKGKLVKKLNALSVLQKNTNPVLSNKARNDMKWVQKNL